MIAAVAVSVPSACCSTPRPVRMYTERPAASRRASCRIVAAGTPVTDCVRSGHHGDTERRIAARPVVRSARYADVVQALGEHDVRDAEQEREVGAGDGLDMDAGTFVGEPRGRAAARVDDDESAAGAGALQVRQERRHRVADVGAEQQHGVGGVEIRERERQPAVDAERAIRGGRGRRHAEAPVVVDAGGAQRDARELAELVRLLVREPAAAEDPDRIRAALRAQAQQLGRQVVECGIPPDRVQLAVRRRGAAAWSAGPVRRAGRRRSSPSCTARPGWWGSRVRTPRRGRMPRPAASASWRTAVRSRGSASRVVTPAPPRGPRRRSCPRCGRGSRRSRCRRACSGRPRRRCRSRP